MAAPGRVETLGGGRPCRITGEGLSPANCCRTTFPQCRHPRGRSTSKPAGKGANDLLTTPLTMPSCSPGIAESRSGGVGRHQAPGQQHLVIVGDGGARQRPEECDQVLTIGQVAKIETVTPWSALETGSSRSQPKGEEPRLAWSMLNMMSPSSKIQLYRFHGILPFGQRIRIFS